MGLFLTSSCSRSRSPITSKADFESISAKTFSSSDYKITGTDSSAGGKAFTYAVILRPNSPSGPISFDFDPWKSFLDAKEKFSYRGGGGSGDLYWQESWGNKKRFITVDAVVMKDDIVKLTYREVLR